MSVTIIGAYLIGKTAIQRYFDDGEETLFVVLLLLLQSPHPCQIITSQSTGYCDDVAVVWWKSH